MPQALVTYGKNYDDGRHAMQSLAQPAWHVHLPTFNGPIRSKPSMLDSTVVKITVRGIIIATIPAPTISFATNNTDCETVTPKIPIRTNRPKSRHVKSTLGSYNQAFTLGGHHRTCSKHSKHCWLSCQQRILWTSPVKNPFWAMTSFTLMVNR